jgi:ubiquinone/menaquinone biosynthesis C-methylase UbiE
MISHTENHPVKTWEETILWIRNQPEYQGLVKEAYYDDPLQSAAERYYQSEEWQAVKAHLPSSGIALDVGAGRGIASYALAKSGFTVTALEPNPSLLVGGGAIRNLANQTHLPIQVVEQPSETLPFPDHSFDIVFARAVLHHTQDLGQATSEIYRVLKPKGLFIAIREHVISKAEDLSLFHQLHPLHKFYGGEHAYLLADYLSALNKAGFKIEKSYHAFSSPINYAPQTQLSLRKMVVNKITRNSLPETLQNWLIKPDFVWQVVFKYFHVLDHRPGRLYSFVCQKI